MKNQITPSEKGEQSSRGLVIVEWQRRSEVLRRPKLPCLSDYHTINLTAGCPNECRYCYAQSYAHHPGWGKLAFYSNLLDRLKKEFHDLQPRPSLVYFSTASEPFLNVERILDHLYEIMEFLLDEGVMLLISTKGVIPDRFIALFRRFPEHVHIQVGITTSNDRIRNLMEPNAATVEQQLDNLRNLIAAGIGAEARMDPLIPDLTDTLDGFRALMPLLQKQGVRRAVASHLFLRWGIRPPLGLSFYGWSFQQMKKRYTHKVTDYCGGGTIWLPSTTYRRERYDLLKDVASEHGIEVQWCHCKNADLTEDCCHGHAIQNLADRETFFGLPWQTRSKKDCNPRPSVDDSV